MQSGVAMLLRQMGLDPDVMKNTVEDTAKAMKGAYQMAEKIQTDLARVERKLDRVLALTVPQVTDAIIEELNGTENR
jgi:hypothetical protein